MGQPEVGLPEVARQGMRHHLSPLEVVLRPIQLRPGVAHMEGVRPGVARPTAPQLDLPVAEIHFLEVRLLIRVRR